MQFFKNTEEKFYVALTITKRKLTKKYEAISSTFLTH